MEQQRVRIVDIAEELGLSTATVSNVIHGKTQKISDATVKRVQALLEERQYVPSMAGILLAQNSSRIIGVFVNDHEKYEGRTLEDAFIASSLNYLSREIEQRGLFMMVKRAKDSGEILRFASMWNLDGVVVLGFCEQDYNDLRDRIRIPFVVYDGICAEPKRFVNITIDDRSGGRQVGEYLRQKGHHRAVCIADNEQGCDLWRMEGFREGFAPGVCETLLVPMHKAERLAFYEAHLEALLHATAVFAVSDYYAIDLMSFLHRKGIGVPQRMAVAGFDDIPLCEMSCPPLTTIRQDGALRARLALENLEALRTGTQPGATLTVPVTLVQRESA